MFSRDDISKALCKKILITDFTEKNLKENSYNFTASNFAWTMSGGVYEGQGEDELTIKKGEKCVVKNSAAEKIILFPNSVTIVMSKEVLGLAQDIGGICISKVGILSKGVGAINTMLGPNYVGHLLIPLQNPTKEIIELNVEDTIISLVFFKLKTKLGTTINNTSSGQSEILSGLGIKLRDTDMKELFSDDHKDFSKVKNAMEKEETYKNYKESDFKKKSWRRTIRTIISNEWFKPIITGVVTFLLGNLLGKILGV